VRRYDAGKYDEIFDARDVIRMWMMLPLYREIPIDGDKLAITDLGVRPLRDD
jgi:hypothetical protein